MNLTKDEINLIATMISKIPTPLDAKTRKTLDSILDKCQTEMDNIMKKETEKPNEPKTE